MNSLQLLSIAPRLRSLAILFVIIYLVVCTQSSMSFHNTVEFLYMVALHFIALGMLYVGRNAFYMNAVKQSVRQRLKKRNKLIQAKIHGCSFI